MLFISEKVLTLQPILLVSSSIYDIYVLGLLSLPNRSIVDYWLYSFTR